MVDLFGELLTEGVSGVFELFRLVAQVFQDLEPFVVASGHIDGL